jgi:hypothetical protein
MLIAALVLLADPTVAPQDPPPASPSVIRIDPQIQSWLDRSPARDDAGHAPIWDEDRTHGELSVGIGTGGYRAFGGSVSTPVGREGRITLHYRQSENEPWRTRRAYDPTYWQGGLGADDRPIGWAGRRLESGAAGQD